MPIRMQDPEQMTLEQMRTLVDSSQTVRFSIEGREAFLQPGEPGVETARLRPVEQRTQRDCAVLSSQSDRSEQGADHTADRAVDAIPFDSGQPAPPAAVPEPVHGPRLRPLGGGGSSARWFVRTSGAADTATGI